MIASADVDTMISLVGGILPDRAPARTDAGRRQHLDWLTADRLVTETGYQRVLAVPRVRKIAREFDPDLFGVLLVSARPDGTLAVIDGQHRVMAVRHRGEHDRPLPCLVFHGLTYGDENTIFSETQRRRVAVPPYDLFNSDLERGDPAAVAIARVLAEVGYRLVPTGTRGDGAISSVTGVRHLYATGGEAGLRAALATCAAAWGTQGGVDGDVLRGVGRFVGRYAGVYDRGRLQQTLALTSPAALRAAGREQQRLNDVDVMSGIARTILRLYNRGLRSRHLDPWDAEPGWGHRRGYRHRAQDPAGTGGEA